MALIRISDTEWVNEVAILEVCVGREEHVENGSLSDILHVRYVNGDEDQLAGKQALDLFNALGLRGTIRNDGYAPNFEVE